MEDYGGVKRRRERSENLTAPVPIRFLYSELVICERTCQHVPYEHLIFEGSSRHVSFPSSRG